MARSAALKTLVFGRWGASDPPALSPEMAEAFLSGPARHTDTVSAAKALVRDDPRPDLDRVRCPVLLLWGARDNQLPVGDAFEYARRLRAPLRVIADCGHLLIGERPKPARMRSSRSSRRRSSFVTCLAPDGHAQMQAKFGFRDTFATLPSRCLAP